LVIKLGENGPSVTCYLSESDEVARAPHLPDPSNPEPTLDASRLVFARKPLNWSQWVSNWDASGNGQAVADGDWHRELVMITAAPVPPPVPPAVHETSSPPPAPAAMLRLVSPEPSDAIDMTATHPGTILSEGTKQGDKPPMRTAEPA
jgi:hypothetical protein